MIYRNIRDVLTLPDVLSGKLWFRPVQWTKSGIALMVSERGILVVPSDRGGYSWRPKVGNFLCDWETVTFDQVLAERQT